MTVGTAAAKSMSRLRAKVRVNVGCVLWKRFLTFFRRKVQRSFRSKPQRFLRTERAAAGIVATVFVVENHRPNREKVLMSMLNPIFRFGLVHFCHAEVPKQTPGGHRSSSFPLFFFCVLFPAACLLYGGLSPGDLAECIAFWSIFRRMQCCRLQRSEFS